MSLSKETTLSPSEVAAQHAENVCRDWRRGYSQPSRKGNGETIWYSLSDGTTYSDIGGDIDCSELGLDCYRVQGIDTGWASYSRNMDLLLDTGNFVDVGLDPDNWTRGDLLVVPGHVAVWLGDGMLAEAHHGDYWGGLDGDEGDWDGTEVRVRSYYDDGWVACYHCTVVRDTSGWVRDGAGWWYRRADGSFPSDCWEYIEGNWYRFTAEGYVVTGWTKEEGDWFMLDPDGSLATGWRWSDGHWFYLDPKPGAPRGRMITGWHKIGDDWFLFGEDGHMKTGWQEREGSWYFLKDSGAMASSCFVRGGQGWYALDKDGKMVTDAALSVGKDGVIKL
jgi:hypothetical protein